MMIPNRKDKKLFLLRKLFFLFMLSGFCQGYLYAQTLNVGDPNQQEQPKEKNEPKITNYKVISETTNDDGSVTRVVEFQKGNLLVRQTVVTPPMPKIGYHKPIDPDTMNHDSVLVYIDKENYLLAVIYKRKRIRQYRAVFGPDRLHDKMREGDRRTPQGWFKIVSKKMDNRWQRFILINYPNDTSYSRFYKRKKAGIIPQSARIGGSIGIHGTYPTGAGMVDLGIGWTDGCISLKPKDIEDLYRIVWPGNRVYIK